MNYETQVTESGKYNKPNYLTLRRWSSYAIQVREAMILKPGRILEIGPGNNIVNGILRGMGYEVETIDIDARVNPNHIGSVNDKKITDKLAGRFDLILACQIFEHLQYEDFLKTLNSSREVAPTMIMSLPYTEINSKFFQFSLKIPGLKKISFASKIIYKPIKHKFNGEHYWEMGKKGYPLARIRSDIESAGWNISKSFLNPDNPFHYFFVLSRK